ncbi:MAG TPA: minichromosome maintenance protein MCM [Acidobacteriota bacterium]|nr:minichromosome maintenance protein MCM [Acidobacteriota bacterium]
MDVAKQVELSKEFLERYYHSPLLETVRKGEKHLAIDFGNLAQFDPELATYLLDKPEDIMRTFQLALEQFDLENINPKQFRFRFFNIPNKDKVMIRNLRSIHLNKLLYIEGVVRQKSDVRPKMVNAKFECPSCGNEIFVAQNEEKLKSPVRCPKCKHQGKFRLLDKELIDAQGMILEEMTVYLEGGQQPKRLKVYLQEDLVSPMSDKKTNPGTSIRIIGILKEIAKQSKDGGKLTTYEYLFEANYFESLNEDYTDIKISVEDEKKILELAKDPQVIEKLLAGVAPGIYGHSIVKEAILLQFVGGVTKRRGDGVKNRGDIHILLIGDPGSGKSQLLKRASVFAPKGRYVSGKGASGAGLTAAVVKDDFIGGWALEAGALVLANRGICLIDELDKMTNEDRSAMHEALEQQTVSISKANIQATLMCETTVLAAANPKMGRFDPFESIAKQIDLPPALINRFDLIFPFRDIPNAEQDERLASFVLDMHKNSTNVAPEVDTDTLRKYIVYARQNCHPQLTDAAIDELKTYYVKMRSSSISDDGIAAISLSARQLEALVRLTESTAKLKLQDKATRNDARRAIQLLDYCLSQIGVDPETGKIDIDRIQTGITTSQRSKVINVREIIKELEEKSGKIIALEEIIEAALAKGMQKEKVEEAIEKLKLNGDIFEPKRGFVSRIV